MSFRLLSCVMVLAIFALIGCSQTESVTGTVTLDGEPLPEAEVEFSPVEGGRPAMGVTGPDGNFELQYLRDASGAMAGKYNVRISTATTRTDKDGNDVEVPEKVPARYQKDGALVKEVVPGSNHFEFKLSSE